uniref:Uncharacterized protein n=1 Tax=Chromera velia CCMP2878 TaxID=1169474 RepID=A0A0G4HBQ4_9ALVE|mmetsp:Transcript_40797/g.80393  ORF Transcript_40797/g.80393 Transcript_40797/m.80393 type:complete len:516 (-) Transcript_40797:267-1814(-)|eukprot:Cvel_26018.t1-p1 / transcript=Cvel_26018.t1 / gene=Cvel_26018 / organism=Chromera_velia_CCMP2878 / gene_product=hypothetical protein / transcript_product=hypothetical protein / location=Cvel_scaffold3029:1184-4204(-) / protein_length=515 / sequence_SO=supercontig / SO=protein_coding / is_pseudo=false
MSFSLVFAFFSSEVTLLKLLACLVFGTFCASVGMVLAHWRHNCIRAIVPCLFFVFAYPLATGFYALMALQFPGRDEGSLWENLSSFSEALALFGSAFLFEYVKIALLPLRIRNEMTTAQARAYLPCVTYHGNPECRLFCCCGKRVPLGFLGLKRGPALVQTIHRAFSLYLLLALLTVVTEAVFSFFGWEGDRGWTVWAVGIVTATVHSFSIVIFVWWVDASEPWLEVIESHWKLIAIKSPVSFFFLVKLIFWGITKYLEKRGLNDSVVSWETGFSSRHFENWGELLFIMKSSISVLGRFMVSIWLARVFAAAEFEEVSKPSGPQKEGEGDKDRKVEASDFVEGFEDSLSLEEWVKLLKTIDRDTQEFLEEKLAETAKIQAQPGGMIITLVREVRQLPQFMVESLHRVYTSWSKVMVEVYQGLARNHPGNTAEFEGSAQLFEATQSRVNAYRASLLGSSSPRRASGSSYTQDRIFALSSARPVQWPASAARRGSSASGLAGEVGEGDSLLVMDEFV